MPHEPLPDPTGITSGAATLDGALGRDLCALTMGMDALERRLSGGEGALDSEGLVPIYLGQDLAPPAALNGWPEAFERLDALDAQAQGLPQGPRRVFVAAMIDSLRAAAQLFDGQELSFAEKLERLVGVPSGPVEAAVMDALAADLDAALTGAGFGAGRLSERARRWEDQRALPPEEVIPLTDRLMLEARERTNATVFNTGDYNMSVRPVSGVPYTARCSFNDGQMDLNLDIRFTAAALKHLVCHEVFPGHSTQLLYTLHGAQSGSSTLDALLCTANAATGAVQEGIGDQGQELIDWVQDADDSVQLGLRALRSAAATSAAWHQMGDGWALERVRDYLNKTAFPQAAWVEGRLRFAAHPFKGAFIASYWFGDRAVREARLRAGQDRRQEFITFLYGEMNTPASLRAWA